MDMSSRKTGPARLLILLLGAAAGCRGREEILTIHCGAGLQPPLAEAIALFQKERGVSVAADYAGSEVLLSKIRLTREGDVFLPGDADYVDRAGKEGLVLHRRTVAFLVPAILVPKGNPRGIRGVEDLVRPGLRLGLGNPRNTAVGRLTPELLKKHGLPPGALEKNTVFLSATVNELALQIQAGSLDAVIVWDAVAAQYARHGETVSIPPDRNVYSTVDAAVLACCRDPGRAREFVEFLASERGRAIFRRHHYRVEPPDGTKD